MDYKNTQETIDLTHDIKELARIVVTDNDIDHLLRRGLDWLQRLCPYDLATIFRIAGEDLVIRAARGPLATSVLQGHSLSLDRFPSIREALDTRRARAFSDYDHMHGDGDPFAGVLDLPHGHSCMVVPLCAGDAVLGVMTLDRKSCGTYPEQVVNLVEVYGHMLALAIHNAEQKAVLMRLDAQRTEQIRYLEAEIGGSAPQTEERSKNPTMRTLHHQARQVAQTSTPVLLLGETGTGKERLALAIHRWSQRADKPFVKVNCAAIPAGLLESELFGHQKGAFTGATRDRAGRFQTANGGTILLDEIGELPVELQAKLLRVLQEGTFEPIGSDRTVKVDVRLLTATHVDLLEATRTRRFREDLYYRLAVFPLHLPPLRQRLEDLPDLCATMLDEQAARTGRSGRYVTPKGIDKLLSYKWPGNLRELANVLERATILSPTSGLGPECLDVNVDDSNPAALAKQIPMGQITQPTTQPMSLDEVQKQHIEATLRLTKGKIYGDDGAAKLLGLPPSTLQSKIKKLGVGERV
ncbi:MAG: sigma 54-interacting transcriptional regulator [Myxococcales bacterium]|nr:sigma 54-interacting transcriptional regulator [Myxococcales bacterium]